jgi:hypothetical protein
MKTKTGDWTCKAHTHNYVQHPKFDSMVYCNIAGCGFAVARATLACQPVNVDGQGTRERQTASNEINPIASHEAGLHAGRSQRGCPICAKYDLERENRRRADRERLATKLRLVKPREAGCATCGGIGFGSKREACAECGR